MAIAGFKGAAEALREASTVLCGELAPGEQLQTHAAVADANAAGIERIEARIARLLESLQQVQVNPGPGS